MEPRFEDQCLSLEKWINENFGEIDALVAVGKDSLFVYVQRGWKHRSNLPTEWEGIPVVLRNTGKIKPL